MNSLYENRNSVGSDLRYQQLVESGAICSECGWLAIHTKECSKSQATRR